jgi:hypothetical protein
MRENLIEKYPNISSIQSIVLLPYSRDVRFRFKETRKTYYLDSDEILLTKKVAFQSRLDDKNMGFEMNCAFIAEV